MRVRAKDILRHPHDLGLWWEDLPMRQRMWWREVLLTKSEGWLCWKPAWRERIWYDPPDIDQWQVFPPLRRAWLALTTWCWLPWAALRGQIRWSEARTVTGRHGDAQER